MYNKLADMCNSDLPKYCKMNTLEAQQISIKLTEAAMWLRLHFDVEKEPTVEMKHKVTLKEKN